MIKTRLVSARNGMLDYHVNASNTSIYRAKVPIDADPVDIVNLYYGDNGYIPKRQEAVAWHGKRSTCSTCPRRWRALL